MTLRHRALSYLDELMQGLKDNDPTSISAARKVLIEMAEQSSASQLWAMPVPVKCLFERETDTKQGADE